MQKENLKFSDSNIFEGMPSLSAIIKSIENNISDRKIKSVLIDNSKKVSKSKEIAFIKAKSISLSFEIKFVDAAVIAEIAVGNTHGGIIAECSERTIPSLDKNKIAINGVYYLLEGIEDPYNFGNAIRSLYASGADGLIVGERNWLGVAGTVARSSAGTSELIQSYMCDTLTAINIFKECGYRVICAGIRDSRSIFECDLSKPLLVILGGEKRGISRAVLELADDIVRIDYGTDFRGSLSSSASAAIFGFEILRYNKK